MRYEIGSTSLASQVATREIEAGEVLARLFVPDKEEASSRLCGDSHNRNYAEVPNMLRRPPAERRQACTWVRRASGT